MKTNSTFFVIMAYTFCLLCHTKYYQNIVTYTHVHEAQSDVYLVNTQYYDRRDEEMQWLVVNLQFNCNRLIPTLLECATLRFVFLIQTLHTCIAVP